MARVPKRPLWTDAVTHTHRRAAFLDPTCANSLVERDYRCAQPHCCVRALVIDLVTFERAGLCEIIVLVQHVRGGAVEVWGHAKRILLETKQKHAR